MRYLDPKFSVGSPGTQAYADAWDLIFKPVKSQESAGESEAVAVEVTRVYDGEGVAGKGPVGEGRLPEAAPSNREEGGVSGFPDLNAAGGTR